MPVGNIDPPKVINPIEGIEIGVVAAGVRYKNRDDLVMFKLADKTNTAVVTTQNKCCAAPVQILRKHIKAPARYLIINTGNANAATGEEGLKRALSVCEALADKTTVDTEQILPFSTGVIGEALNIDAIKSSLENCLADLSSSNWLRAANAIRTTDTIPKLDSIEISVGDTNYHITGISKGAGMIRPNMATMLGFIATDANIKQTLLQTMLNELTEASFNRITVDGDTSTNDCCVLMATGTANTQVIDSKQHPHYQAIYDALKKVFLRLATLIVRDGEGATKFITVKVTGGATTEDCCDVSYAVAHSPLVKTAFFASDPNWGRIMAAVGYSGAKSLDANQVCVKLDDVNICTRGQLDQNYSESQGQEVMSRPEITIHIDLGQGEASDTVYTCDLSHEYVSINADYRS